MRTAIARHELGIQEGDPQSFDLVGNQFDYKKVYFIKIDSRAYIL